MKAHFRIIGDVHSRADRYLALADGAEYSIQVGDMGFDYGFLRGADPARHRFIGGNHDNYDRIGGCAHHLGDFGIWPVPGLGELFFVRGGFSVDQAGRTEGVNWWRAEELSAPQANLAFKSYSMAKPDIVVSHECPFGWLPNLVGSRVIRTRTNQMLQAMLDAHAPGLWAFGHFHMSVRMRLGRTLMVCLDELEALDFAAGQCGPPLRGGPSAAA